MKNLFKSIASVAIVAMAFAGCSKEATDVTAPITKKGITVRFNAEVIDETRATLNPNDGETEFIAAWEDKDQIGITAESMKDDDIREDIDLCGKRENGEFSTTFQNCTEAADLWYYNAYYPYTDNTLGYKGCQIVIPFGGERIQYGNDYNSAYDIMAASIEMTGTDLQPGVDENGDKIVFNMKRMTAIAYFHFTTTAEAKTDKVLSVTLSATPSKELEPLAANGALLFYGSESTDTKHSLGLHDGATNSIKITYDSATAPTAADFKAWFNVLPGIFSDVKLVIETENYTAEIARTGDVMYEAGKLAKVSGKISDGKWTKKKEIVADGTTLWSEDFSDLTIDKQSGSSKAYNGDTITYKFSGTGSKLYNETLAGGTSPELLLSKNTTWTVSDIPTGGCNLATLSFASNKDIKSLTSTTTGVSITELKDADNTYEISFKNVETFEIIFTAPSSNVRIDDVVLVVGVPKGVLSKPEITTDVNKYDVTISWNAIDNATKYVVECDDDNEWNGTGTSCSFSGLKPGKHTITVTAESSTGYASSKSSKEIEIQDYNVANPAITSTSLTTTTLKAAWVSVTNASGYEWYLTTTDGATVVDKTNTTDTSINHTGTFEEGKEYVLYVKSVTEGMYDAPEEYVSQSVVCANAETDNTYTDTLTADMFKATSTTYTDFTGVSYSDGSPAVYAGNSAKNNVGAIQLRSKNSNSGIVTTTSGGKVKKITIQFASGSNTLDVYGKSTAYTAASDLYNNTTQGTKIGSLSKNGTIEVTGDYEYIGLRSNNGAIYITSIIIVWEK